MNYLDSIKNILSSEPQIIGKDRYLNSAVLIPLIIIGGNEHILFEKRSKSVRQPGEISFPGGHFEKKTDSNSLDTAIRETYEELGIDKSKIKVIGKTGTLVAPMGVIVESFAGFLDIPNLEELNIDKKEVESVFTVPLEFFIKNEPLKYEINLEIHPYRVNDIGEREELLPVKEIGLPERYGTPWKNGKHRVLVYKTNDEIIWGITAELIYDLSIRLKNGKA